ncbi:T9SS type A sorting domain-containing protein [Epilithonimonas sp. UC225_85]|uniref:T9SS type A sorting domain-containing protein n=1 Tax=Epilithonimonas sp. UC225_85 TaxID=3350167 RepID=UPI0036D3BF58
MKVLLSLFGFLFISGLVNAQQYQTITIQSGFNADVIANGIGPASSSTNNNVDGDGANVGFALVSRDYKLASTSTLYNFGLPANGLINSVVGSTNGLTYQLQSYNTNNALRLGSSTSGTFVFTTPVPAVTLFMLATSGNGDSYVTVVVNFSDNTTQIFNNVAIRDWYNWSDYAIGGIGRINIANNNLESDIYNNPRIYQIPLPISSGNQSKSIKSITITKSGGTGIPNVFAFSADVYSACKPATNITVSTTTTTAALSWTAPSDAPSAGYQYYYTRSSVAPTDETAPSGIVAAGQTSVSLSDLVMGETYYFWLRSNCGTGKGLWIKKEFATTFTSAQIVPDSNGRVYVNLNANAGSGTGISWTNAVKRLVPVISAANTNSDIKEIWVAKGTYYPSLTSNRDDFLYVTRNNLKIYGGFTGTETSLNQRNIKANETILSGNIGNPNSATDNSYHIMIIDAYNGPIDNSTHIDGFTFQDGNASDGSLLNSYFPRYSGSAILIYPSGNDNAPLISDNVFRNNSQFQIGALSIDGNTVGTNVARVENCEFYNNYSKFAGGAIGVYNHLGTQNVEIKDCLFEGNLVDNESQGGSAGGAGAAIYIINGSNVTINRSKFVNNRIGNYTQYVGTYKGTAIAATLDSEVTLVNSLIYSDETYVPLFNNGSTFNIINSTVYNPDGGTILTTVAPILNSIQNSIFWMGGNSVNVVDGSGTTVTANNSIIFPKYNVTLNGSNNYTSDPLFNNFVARDFSLKSTSNGINQGNNSFYDSSKYGNNDLGNNSRIQETTIDIGAFEKQSTLSSSDIGQNRNIKLYPNPVKDVLNLDSESKIIKVIISDYSGRKILEKPMGGESKIDVKSLNRGIYIIQISTEKETKTLLKFIKD